MSSVWPRTLALLVLGLVVQAPAAASGPLARARADGAGPYSTDAESFGRRELVLQETDFLWRAQSWADFEAKARELAEQSLRLVDVDVHVVGDQCYGTVTLSLAGRNEPV